MDLSVVPWTPDEVIDFACLVVGAVMVTSFPVVYAMRAQLRDRLAVVMVVATGATAIAFDLSVVFWLAIHAGHPVDEAWGHWISRAVYLTVGFGKVMLLWQMLQVVPNRRRRRG